MRSFRQMFITGCVQWYFVLPPCVTARGYCPIGRVFARMFPALREERPLLRFQREQAAAHQSAMEREC